MPPRRPTSSRASSSAPSGGASKNDRTVLKPSPYASRRPRGSTPREDEVDGEPSMDVPEDEEYRTSNHYPGELEEEDPSEGTPVGDDPRKVVSKEMMALEDEEDELPEEDDDNPDATRAGPPVSLHILEGPDAGKKRRFKSVRMVVGRAQGVDLRLNDQAVSRRHLELVHGDSGTVLRDLVSASGTRVNDERVDECVLKHGDIISIGKTQIRYVDELEQVKQLRAEQEAREAEAKRAEEEARKKQEEEAEAKKAAAADASAAGRGEVDPNDPRFNEATNARYVAPESLRNIPTRRPGQKLPDNKVLMAGGAGVAVVVLLVVSIIIMGKKDPPPPPPPDPKEQLASTKMQQARSAIREGNFADAAKLAEEAEALQPGIDQEALARRAAEEQAALEALEAVRSLLSEERFEDARQRLDAAPKGTTAKVAEERESLDKELKDAEAAFYTQRADELLAQRDVESVRALLSRLPFNAQPLYNQRLSELEQELAREAEQEAKLVRTNKALAARRAAEQRARFIAEAFYPVERKFENGDFERAVLECDRVIEANKADQEIRERARELKKLIPQFARVFQDAMRKVQANSLEAAVRPLKRSEELYRQIGFKGPLLDEIRGRLGEASTRAGKAALARKDVASAANYFREALRLNPDDRSAREGLASLQGDLDELFKRAYIEKDRDPRAAAEKFRIVIDAAPEGSELKRKAETHLQMIREQQP
jgi:pSer/pThr/pTyr-binding forkhead associated (FHA) protein/tetratricopeptide (TPR) repeat protein